MPTEPFYPRALLFDVDGTLIDSYHLYLESYRRALPHFLGYVPTEAEMLARRPSSERRYFVDWVGEARAERVRAAMQAHYAELHGALCGGVYDGVREMLAVLRGAGLPLGVVTGKGRTLWEVTERRYALGPFGAVVTDDDVAHPKPHPGGLLDALAQMGVSPAEAVYVGDTVGDMEAGRNAGMRIGAALWPKTAPGEKEAFLAEIRHLQPEWAWERPAEVVRTFVRWC